MKAKSNDNQRKVTSASQESSADYVIIPPNGGWGWVVVFSAFYCNLVLDGIQLTFGIFMPEIAKHFDVELSKVSLIGSLMFGLHLLIGPACAGFSSVYGIRAVSLVGSLIVALGISISYFAFNYQMLYVTYGFMGGLGFGLIYMNTIVVTSLYFSTLRALALAIVVCGTGCGTMGFALLGNYLMKITTWQVSMLIQAGLAGSMFLAAATFRPLKPQRMIVTPEYDFDKRMSVVSKVSRYPSDHSWVSRKENYFVKKTNPSMTSMRSVHTVVVDKLAHQNLRHQIRKKAYKKVCCRCCHRETVVFINPDRKNEFYSDLNSLYPQGSSVSSEVGDKGLKKKSCDCSPLKDTCIAMFDFKLLRSCAFFLYCCSGCFAIASLLVVLLYVKDRSVEQNNYSEDIATYLLVTLGASNMMWRLFLGALTAVVKVNITNFYVGLCILSAFSSFASTISSDIYLQFASCIGFSLGTAGFAVFRPMMLIELVGTDLVLNATGIAMLFMGLGSIAAPPFSGFLMERTGDYNSVFFAAGAMMLTSGLLSIQTPALRQRELRRLNNRH